ncbi:tail tip protein M [Halomonas phage vB_HmeY_H4907]|nr:tail tip protein M [Halomonas phage vB_HmeY_H4907]
MAAFFITQFVSGVDSMDRLPSVGRWPGIAYGLEEKGSYARDVIKFGDGYEQRARIGINSFLKNWSMRWPHLRHSDVLILTNFLNSKVGVDAFIWGHPITGVDYSVVCDEVPVVVYDSKGRGTVTAVFREVVA